jgi:hypothetical protein
VLVSCSLLMSDWEVFWYWIVGGAVLLSLASSIFLKKLLNPMLILLRPDHFQWHWCLLQEVGRWSNVCEHACCRWSITLYLTQCQSLLSAVFNSYWCSPIPWCWHGYLSPFISLSLHLSVPPPVSLLCKQKMREAGIVVLPCLCGFDKKSLEKKQIISTDSRVDCDRNTLFSLISLICVANCKSGCNDFEVRHPRCVLNHSVENEYEKQP